MRASRLVRILLLLQTRGTVTADELAAELEVSVRTIYRDLADLGGAGVPVYGERGEGGGYRLVGGYRTSLTGLTSDETSVLMLGGAAGPMADELGIGGLVAATRLKLLAAIPPGMRGVATRAEQRFHLDPGGWAHAQPGTPVHLEVVARATWEDRVLRLRYGRNVDTAGRRTVHPLGLVHKAGTWYLVATHRSRLRVYRTDRIHAAEMIDQPATRPADFDLVTFWSAWEQAYAASLPQFMTTVRLGPGARRYRDVLGGIAPRAITDEHPVDADGWQRQTLLFDNAGIARAALLALAPDVEVLAPADLRADVGRVAHVIARRHTCDPKP
ncbi:WYL domain-containing protein [soil metagenome]